VAALSDTELHTVEVEEVGGKQEFQGITATVTPRAETIYVEFTGFPAL
jgi:hypothetical protein